MKVLIDDFALHYPGIETIQHEYFYAVHGADLAARHAYLERAFIIGREFAKPGLPASR
jgi:NAD(P)H dehydrogenase (quinone)